MQIYVDADACPKVIKKILYKTANRLKIQVTFVANRYLSVPDSNYIRSIKVDSGIDVADETIVGMLESGDLVITADVPLANETIEKGAFAINPRGELYTKENMRHLLSIRNAMQELRDGGVDTGGPKAFSQRDQLAFGNQLDRFLTKYHKTIPMP